MYKWRNRVRFVIGWIALALFMAGCSQSTSTPPPYVEIEGDAARGEQLFSQVSGSIPPCSGCHISGVSAASPDLTGYGAVAGERVAGQSAAEYTFYSITDPGQYVVPDYGNAMYNRYGEALTEQQIADLIAYLLTL